MDLKIDSVFIKQPSCSEETGSLTLNISGGKKPYTVTLNETIINDLQLNSILFDNLDNKKSYLLMVIDSEDNIVVYPDEIGIFTKETKITIDIESPQYYNETAPSVKLNIDGYGPYKIQWIKNNEIIAENINELNNILKAGDYSVIIQDNNGCEFSKNFVINQPKPIGASYRTRADITHNNYYSFSQVEKIRNTIIIPKNKFPELTSFVPGDIIKLYHKNRKSNIIDQTIVFDAKTVTIDNKEFYQFYIANGIKLRGLSTLENNNYILNYQDVEYPLSLQFNKEKCCLLIGCLILSNDYSFAFHKNDTIELDIDGSRYKTRLTNITNKMNYYLPMINTTILFIENSNRSIIQAINNDTNSFYVRSLSTKKSQNKGNIILKINDTKGVSNTYKVSCEGLDNDFSQIYYTTSDLRIGGLDCGNYKVKIVDAMDRPVVMINDELISDDSFIVNILGSEQAEYNQIINKLISKQSIEIKSLESNQKTLKKLFKPSAPQIGLANLLINIRPYDSKVEVFGPDNYYYNSNSSYELINNINPGKYKIKINDKSTECYIIKNTTHYINEI